MDFTVALEPIPSFRWVHGQRAGGSERGCRDANRLTRSFTNFFLENLQSLLDQLPPKFFFLLGRQLGVAGWADDTAGSHGTEGAHFLGHRDHRADLRHRYVQPLDFFADRCAAASAGASGGSQDDPGHAGGL